LHIRFSIDIGVAENEHVRLRTASNFGQGGSHHQLLHRRDTPRLNAEERQVAHGPLRRLTKSMVAWLDTIFLWARLHVALLIIGRLRTTGVTTATARRLKHHSPLDLRLQSSN